MCSDGSVLTYIIRRFVFSKKKKKKKPDLSREAMLKLEMYHYVACREKKYDSHYLNILRGQILSHSTSLYPTIVSLK